MKNYYQILNIRPTATEDDIKRSYRVLAKKYHPDVNPGDAAAADKFADINEANAVLSDPKSRAEYDAKLQEANAPKPNPEDVIARQRAQAQAAARQAAARQAAFQNSAFSATAQRNVRMEQARAAAANKANAQFQAQVQAMCNQAYASGHEQGVADAKKVAESEIAKLNATVRSLTEDNNRLKKKLDDEILLKQQLIDSERDRRELEQELFNRDRELSQEQLRAKEIEDRLRMLREERENSVANAEEVEALKKERDELRSELDDAKRDIQRLEQERTQFEQGINQSELKNKAQLQLQHDKRKQMQEEIDALHKQIDELTAELEELRSENDQWQQYATSEQFLSDAERRLDDWNKKTQADRRLAKPTLYGALGVLIWATSLEIDEAYAKLKKRYGGKSDDASIAKLAKVEEAYATLSEPQKRKAYNKTIGITNERIDEERKLILENESLLEEYRARLATKEFWERFDDINASALAGDASAQNTLGEMYYYGDEIERDIDQAVFWFKEAAKQKNPDGMYNLGICFINGEGIDQNKDTGEGFIRQAARLGSKQAQQYINPPPKKTAAKNKKTDS